MSVSHIVAHMCGSQFKPPVVHHSFVVMNSLSDIYHNHTHSPLIQASHLSVTG